MIERRRLERDGGTLLLDAVRSVHSLVDLSSSEWDLLLRLAHRNRLLGRLAERLEADGLLDRIPAKAGEILHSAQVSVLHRHQQMRWELDRIAWALSKTDIRAIALKGAAYLLCDLPLARAASARTSICWSGATDWGSARRRSSHAVGGVRRRAATISDTIGSGCTSCRP